MEAHSPGTGEEREGRVSLSPAVTDILKTVVNNLPQIIASTAAAVVLWRQNRRQETKIDLVDHKVNGKMSALIDKIPDAAKVESRGDNPQTRAGDA